MIKASYYTEYISYVIASIYQININFHFSHFSYQSGLYYVNYQCF